MRTLHTTPIFRACFMMMALALCTAHAAASNEKQQDFVTQAYELDKYSAISTSQGIRIVYAASTERCNVNAKIDSRYADHFYVETKNGTLRIGFRNLNNINLDKYGYSAIVTVFGPSDLKKLEASSAGSIEVTTPLEVDGTFSIVASSAGKISTAALTCKKLDADASSAADINLTNVNCQEADLNSSSAADITVNGLASTKIDADASSTANVTITGITCDEFKSSVSSQGKGEFEGTGKTVNLEASSAGKIEASQLLANAVITSANTTGKINCNSKNAIVKSTSTDGTVNYSGKPVVINMNVGSDSSQPKM